MKVSLIDYTGAGQTDPMWAAKLLIYTKNTRLTQGEGTRKMIFEEWGLEKIAEELDYISKTLRSSWEFCDFTFEITGVTRAFTHQFVRTRTASYAQQAQRVVDLSSFETMMPETVKEVDDGAQWEALMKLTSETYEYYQSAGVPNQDCRGVLPTNVLTNIMAKMNLRTLADLAGKRDNLRAQGEYVDVFRAMAAEAIEAMPWVESFLYPERTSTPELDKLLAVALGSASPIDKPALNAALKELDGLKGIWG